jgi:hypothetical protein
MPSLADIEKQIADLPHKYIFYTRKEVRYLPKVLGADERILALTSGFMNNHTWLCVCTNHRILLIDRGMFFGLRQVQMNLDRLQSIDSSFTIFFGRLRFWDGASSISIGLVLKSSIAPFVRTVQEAMDAYKRQMANDLAHRVQSASTPQTSATPWLTELERLSALKNAGELSEDEFKAAKAKLLGK